MTNPARRLHKIYSDWGDLYSPSSSALTSRELDGAGDSGIPQHIEVFRLLIALDHSLDYLEKKSEGMEVYRENYPAWVKMALNVPNNWTSQTNRPQGFPVEPMSHLWTFGTLLQWDNPGLMPEPEAKLRGGIDAAMKLLLEDETISDGLRAYVYKLVQEISIALDDESVMGSFDFAHAAERLWVAMFAAAGQSRRPKKWRDAANSFFRDSAVGVVASLPSVGLTLLQLQQSAG